MINAHVGVSNKAYPHGVFGMEFGLLGRCPACRGGVHHRSLTPLALDFSCFCGG